MRNAVVDLEAARREADRQPKAHAMQRFFRAAFHPNRACHRPILACRWWRAAVGSFVGKTHR